MKKYALAYLKGARILYHGSSTANLKKLEPHPSGDLKGQSALYATPDIRFALTMAPKNIPQYSLDVGYEGNEKKKDFYLKELQPGALKYLDVPASMYELKDQGFSPHPNLMPEEVISHKSVKPIRHIVIANVLKALQEAGVKPIPYRAQ